MSELNVDQGRPRRKAQPPAVPDAEFDFSKGNERFQKERQARKDQEDNKEPTPESDSVDLGEPEKQPHPSAVVKLPPTAIEQPKAPGPGRKTGNYTKSSFFDNISSDSSRVSRAEERHRNFDTFGEAGGQDAMGLGGGPRFGQQGGRGGMPGRGRGRGGRRGGFNSNQAFESS